MSDRSSAAIASAVLLDARRAGLITADAEELVIDPSRLRRERTRMREEESAKARQLLRKPLSVFFDDRKDNTQMFVSNGGRWRRRIKKEVHTSLVAEPGGHYLGHVVPRSGKSSDISASIAEHVGEHCYTPTSLQAVGSDGTPINTGHNNGVIRELEKHWKKPVQWIVCMLHGNELPLRHLMKLDGPTSGLTAFSGEIGNQLSD